MKTVISLRLRTDARAGSSLGMQPPHTMPSDVLMLPGAESQMMHTSLVLHLGRSVIMSGRMVLGYKMYVVRL